MQEIPKFHETFIPILEALSSTRELTSQDLAKRVQDNYYSNLSPKLLAQKVSNGNTRIKDRISWGASYLKIAGYLSSPARGKLRITEKGLEQFTKGQLSLAELKSQPEYVSHQKSVQDSKIEAPEVDASSSPQDLIDAGYDQIQEQILAELLNKLREVDPYYFEIIILKLLNKMGYGDLIETSKSNDGGIDGIINEDELGLAKIYIQAKRYGENKVREKDIRNFIGAMSGDTEKGVFVTTSEFDDKAKSKAAEARHKIVLINGIKMAQLMYKYGVGVQTRTTYEIKSIDEDFFEI